MINRFVRSESGATLVEYGIALVVAVVLAGAALTNIAGQTADTISTARDELN